MIAISVFLTLISPIVDRMMPFLGRVVSLQNAPRKSK